MRKARMAGFKKDDETATCTLGGIMIAVKQAHTEGWSPRHEALMEAVLTSMAGSKNPWIFACDGNMSRRRETTLLHVKEMVEEQKSKPQTSRIGEVKLHWQKNIAKTKKIG